MRRLVAVGVLVAVIGAGLLAWSGLRDRHDQPATVVQSAPDVDFRDPSLTECTSYLAGSGLSVTFRGRGIGAASCQGFNQRSSSASAFWTLTPSVDATAQTIACAVAKEGVRAIVADTGGHFGGQRVCGSLVSRGWVEVQLGDE